MTAPRAAPLAAVLILLWLVGYAPVLLGGRTFAGAAHAGDTLVWHQQTADAIAGGHLPEWDGTSGLGQPLAGAPGRSALYPPVWLEAIAPTPWSADAVLAAHLLLLAFGVALWSRRIGADPAAAAAAGAAAALSGLATSIAAVMAAAWLPLIAWAASRLSERGLGPALAVAAGAGAMLLAGPSGPAFAAPIVAVAAVLSRPSRRAFALLAAALVAAILAGAAGLLPAAALGSGPGDSATASLHPVNLPLLGFSLLAVMAERRLAAAALLLIAGGYALPWVRDGALAGGLVIAWSLAGLGLSRAFSRLVASGERWRAAAASLLAVLVLGPPAVRVWRSLVPRAELERPPALVAGIARDDAPLPARIAWPDRGERPYRDAPPRTAARFGFAYVPGDRDQELTALWRASSGAGERLLDLFGVEYVLVPRSVVAPASLEVVGTTARGDWVLAKNARPRPRAFVAPRWSWHRDAVALAAALFPAAPDSRGNAPLAEVRLIGSGEPGGAASPLQPAPPCAIRAPRPEQVELDCHSPAGGHAVLLDRFALGWTASVDGRPVEIERADLLVRAVPVTAGRHRIRFHYRTPGLRLGLVLSGIAWLNLAALAIVLGRRRKEQ